MKKLKFLTAATLAALVYSSAASSSVIGTLTFIDPTGNVSASEAIDVWVRLTLDEASDALAYDSAAPFPNGVDPDDLPVEGRNLATGDTAAFDSYDFLSPFASRTCDDTFTVGCTDDGSQYAFESPSSASSWFNFSGTLNPGQSMDFVLWTLSPVGGAAAPGTYELFSTGLGLLVFGQDINGNELIADIFRISTDCNAADCAFTRTVTAVPVPAAAWLLGSALLGLLGAARRKVR